MKNGGEREKKSGGRRNEYARRVCTLRRFGEILCGGPGKRARAACGGLSGFSSLNGSLILTL